MLYLWGQSSYNTVCVCVCLTVRPGASVVGIVLGVWQLSVKWIGFLVSPLASK